MTLNSVPSRCQPSRCICKHEGCNQAISVREGLCISHGAKKKKDERPQCSHEGCITKAVRGGFCWAHDENKDICNIAGCERQALRSGVLCIKHYREKNNIVKKIIHQPPRVKKKQPTVVMNSMSSSAEAIESNRNNKPEPTTKCKVVKEDCSKKGCTAKAYMEGVCKKHGKKENGCVCKIEGCSKQAITVKEGLCISHGAKRKMCSAEGCTNFARAGGICITHGAPRPNRQKTRQLCSTEGCSNVARQGGMCHRHGGKDAIHMCKVQGCTSQAITVREGVCRRHGAKVTGKATAKQPSKPKKRDKAKRKRKRTKEKVAAKPSEPTQDKAKRKRTKEIGSICKEQEDAIPINKKQDQGLCVTITDGAAEKKRKVWKKRKLCKVEGCTRQAITVREGVCIPHGAHKIIRKIPRSEKPICSHEGCTNQAYKGGVCHRHNKNEKQLAVCSHEGCTAKIYRGGVCCRHDEICIKLRKELDDDDDIDIDIAFRIKIANMTRSQLAAAADIEAIHKGSHISHGTECPNLKPNNKQDQGLCVTRTDGAIKKKRKVPTHQDLADGVLWRHDEISIDRHKEVNDDDIIESRSKMDTTTQVAADSEIINQGLQISHGAGCTNAKPNDKQDQGMCVTITDGTIEKKRKATKRRLCSTEGCSTFARIGGMCHRHGGKDAITLCKVRGCIRQVITVREGLCIRHGAPKTIAEIPKSEKPLCSHEGCTDQAICRGVCRRHDENKELALCSHEGCTTEAFRGGVCRRHDEISINLHKELNEDDIESRSEINMTSQIAVDSESINQGPHITHGAGCTNPINNQDLCISHGTIEKKRKKQFCIVEGCAALARGAAGMCIRHGAKEAKRKPRTRDPLKSQRERPLCSHEGCTTRSFRGGVCRKHDEVLCNVEGCGRHARSLNGGTCIRHDANQVPKVCCERPICSHEGCTTKAVRGGVCWKHDENKGICNVEGCGRQVRHQSDDTCMIHGTKKVSIYKAKLCKVEGCTSRAITTKDGVCCKHGGRKTMSKKPLFLCSHEGCTTEIYQGEVCWRHDEGGINPDSETAKTNKRKKAVCSVEGCTTLARAGGICARHGANEVPNCEVEGCTWKATTTKGGVCKRHEKQKRKTSHESESEPSQSERPLCSHEGCTAQAYRGGVCRRHHVRKEICNTIGCERQVRKDGLCIKCIMFICTTPNAN